MSGQAEMVAVQSTGHDAKTHLEVDKVQQNGADIVYSTSTSPYFALVSAFVASADAQEKGQTGAAEELQAQSVSLENIQNELQSLKTTNGNGSVGDTGDVSKIANMAYMENLNIRSNVISNQEQQVDAKVSVVLQQGIQQSSEKEQAALSIAGSIVSENMSHWVLGA